MERDILCKTCAAWVDCGGTDGGPHGFCVEEPLFTYTARAQCEDYAKGTPITEAEWERLPGGADYVPPDV